MTLMANVINCDCLKLLVNRVFQIYEEMYFASQLLGVTSANCSELKFLIFISRAFYYGIC